MEFHGSPLFAVLTAANAEETDKGRGREKMGIMQEKFHVRRFFYLFYIVTIRIGMRESWKKEKKFRPFDENMIPSIGSFI